MSQKKLLLVFSILCCCLVLIYACINIQAHPSQNVYKKAFGTPRVLVFTRTKGYYHEAIPTGAAAIMQLGKENNFLVDTTPNPDYFIQDSLKNYSLVIFLSTTGNVLNADQQVAFERYIQAGGNYLGIHAAADTEYEWPWYNKLAGAYFLSHPKQQKVTINVTDKSHPSTSFLPDKWERFDELYNYKSVQPDLTVLASLDETTYQGGVMGENHPFVWYHTFDGGRAFYTGGGHTKESYSEPLFLKHLLGGIQYAIGNNAPLDYSKSYAVKAPEDNRFTKTTLTDDLNEPMELDVAPDGRVFFTERAGRFYVFDPKVKKTKLLYNFPAKAVDKYLNGLIGVTLDPDFAKNNYIYFFYSSNTGEQYHQNISRYKIRANGSLDTNSQKVIIQIPIDLEVSAHTGGSLAWDKSKNLFISTGDNTVPFQSDGYAPLDEGASRNIYDAQRSAGNPNDLRGKILRIHPESNGSYTIPDGNLFAKGTPGTRPEIYVMGCRNPYRISVDQETSFLYWGEVGPDAGNDSRHGPRGYDEFNQARKPGNFGWPYFVGDSKAYHDSDFAAKTVGDLFDVNAPVNNSPNNTGAKKLPPPTKPLIWYPYIASAEFPLIGTGGRCAMGGPIFHHNANLTSNTQLPAYYDKAYFIYDWMRNWVFAVRLDENYNYSRMEPFMQTNGDFRRPVDMEIGPDGSVYMLEYGSVYGIDNVDARLVRIDYNGGNRAPVAKITTKDTIGLAPYKVNLSSMQSYDYDEEDKLTYQWIVNGKTISTEANPSYTFAKNGIYKTILKVTDDAGKTNSNGITIKVGNTLPAVTIQTGVNSTFFFPKATAFNYNVDVTDKEDKIIDKNRVKVALKYIAKIAAQETSEIGHQQINENYNYGKSLMAASDCKACHQLNAKSVGPSFTRISAKYVSDKNAVGYLANKIITGGAGVWGEHGMSAHPQISKEDATEIVKYIITVSGRQGEKPLPKTGSVILKDHAGTTDQGRYIITASYTDKGGAALPLTSRQVLVLRPSQVQAEDADVLYNLRKARQQLSGINDGSYFVFKNIDLKDITSLTYSIASLDKDGKIEVHLDAQNGKVISTLAFQPTGALNKLIEANAPVTDPGGRHDLYFVFTKTNLPNRNIAAIDWIRFEGGGKEVIVPPVAAKMQIPVKQNVPVKTQPGKSSGTSDIIVINASPGKALMAKSDCNTCHAPNKKLIGPSFTAIANKYTSAAIAKLTNKVINGGSGVWGQIPMAPHKQLPKKDVTEMVKYIMSFRR